MKAFQMSDIDREKARRMASIETERKRLLWKRKAEQEKADLPPATPGVTYQRVCLMVKRRRVTA